MISLSNVIKSSHYVPLDSKKLIEAATLRPVKRATDAASGSAHQASDLEQAIRDKQVEEQMVRVIDEAKAEAARIIEQAEVQAAQLRESMEQELAAWEQVRRQELEAELERLRQEVREQAYHEGYVSGERAAEEKWRQDVDTASRVLQEATVLRGEIISEAEPFLLELSVQIAESIIGRQLTLEPEWMLDMIRNVLSRERRKGLVTLCVSPEQFPYIREAREELRMVLDSQADLQIIPDTTVRGYGCVVRTDFGSLDARIDAQLSEIKQALLQVYTAEQGVEEE
jgi:flagellar assembly protein FliH